MDEERPKITNLEGREADQQKDNKKSPEDTGETKWGAKERIGKESLEIDDDSTKMATTDISAQNMIGIWVLWRESQSSMTESIQDGLISRSS